MKLINFKVTSVLVFDLDYEALDSVASNIWMSEIRIPVDSSSQKWRIYSWVSRPESLFPCERFNVNSRREEKAKEKSDILFFDW